MRIFTACLFFAAISLASPSAHAAPVVPGALDMCAVDASSYGPELYDNGWLTKLPAKRAAGTAVCERQSMRRLGTAGGRTYFYWEATFVETDLSYSDPRRPHTVSQIGEYDAEGKLVIVHRVSADGEPSELVASVIERDGDVLLAMTDPETRVFLRGPDGFLPLHTGFSLYSLSTGIADAAMPEGYIAPHPEGDEQDGYTYGASFNVEAFALDLPVAVASEVFPRTYIDPDYDRPITLRFPLRRQGDELKPTGAPELIEGATVPNGLGETPASFAIPAATRACSIYAYLEDTDPAGVTVRATPDAKGLPIATLPAGRSGAEGEFVFGADVRIVGSVDGWFLIENAQHPAESFGEVTDGGPAIGAGSDLVRRAYRGRGWVHGSRLSTGIQLGQSLRASADPASAPVFDLKIDSDNYAEVDGFKNCEGQAIEVNVKRSVDGAKGSGWIGGDDGSQLCSNQGTTCS